MGSQNGVQYAYPACAIGEAVPLSRPLLVHAACSPHLRSRDSVLLRTAAEADHVVADGRIYLFGKYGTTTIIESGPQFVPLAKSVIDIRDDADERPTIQHAVAAVDNNLVIRTEREVVCIRQAKCFADITDGSSNTVLMSETVRSVGPDFTLPAGTLPKAPYQGTLNGTTSLSIRSTSAAVIDKRVPFTSVR